MTLPRAHTPALLLAACLFRSLPALAQASAPTPQPAPTDSAAPGPVETTAIHLQSTATEQFSPGFPSAFQGQQSLSGAAAGRETTDVTAYLGVRPWAGAELWFDPEIDQGFGLGDTYGVAGFPSGEAYKVGSATPYVVIQRLFLRQTLDLGGAAQHVDADLNQLAGNQTANRLVITAGKFSIVDIFDTNPYAHDPRNDFLNWSVIDGGAFDYAGNSFGMTYGAAAELSVGRLTLRLGAFDMPTSPNSADLDPHPLSQTQLVAELEERHLLWGRPGALKILYWLDRARLGTYDQAVALAMATRTTPDTGTVRDYRSKDGLALNLAQQLTPDLGLFARASAAQGSVEEDAFSDIDKSAQLGLSLKGSAWHRPNHTLGVAFVVNEISRAGRQYLAAGGLGGIIGDGALPNSGPEQILESFYSLPLYRDLVMLTADYQLINHPAYDADRGPVSVLSARLHMQF